MADGSEHPVTVRDRGLGGIGAMLWWHLLLAALAWTSGWAHYLRQRSLGNGFLALACSGYAVGMALGGLELVHGWPGPWGLRAASTARRGLRCNWRLRATWAMC
jgi:hypothetical protein